MADDTEPKQQQTNVISAVSDVLPVSDPTNEVILQPNLMDISEAAVRYYDDSGQAHIINISPEALSNLVQSSTTGVNSDGVSTIAFNNENYTIVGSYDINESSDLNNATQFVLPDINSHLIDKVDTVIHKQPFDHDDRQNNMQTNDKSVSATLGLPKDNNNITEIKTTPYAADVNISLNNNIAQKNDPIVTNKIGNINATTNEKDNLPPLGSSENPIRIIQQGNQYMPVQQLTSEQLQQIMQVVQNQQLAKTTQQQTTGTSVMFNPETNTRIIYRVVYPNEIHGKTSKGSTSSRKRVHIDDDVVDEATQQERDQRKKVRPRTRSGRVSKPPRHMMADYKHIHRLDWDDDYDDDDGGYSDIKFTQEDIADVPEPEILPLKPKNWVCGVCGKAYIGEANLLRHHSKFPDHANSQLSHSDTPTPTNVGNDDINGGGDKGGEDNKDTDADMIIQNPDGTLIQQAEDMEADDNGANDKTESTVSEQAMGDQTNDEVQTNADDGAEQNEFDAPVKRPRGRPKGSTRGGKGRPRGGFVPSRFDAEDFANRPRKRKNILKQLAELSSYQDLVDIVLPQITPTLSLWEFLLMKLGDNSPSGVDFCDVHRELISLHRNVQKMCAMCVDKATPSDVLDPLVKKFMVDDSPLSRSLNLLPIMYKVKATPNQTELLFNRTNPSDGVKVLTGSGVKPSISVATESGTGTPGVTPTSSVSVLNGPTKVSSVAATGSLSVIDAQSKTSPIKPMQTNSIVPQTVLRSVLVNNKSSPSIHGAPVYNSPLSPTVATRSTVRTQSRTILTTAVVSYTSSIVTPSPLIESVSDGVVIPAVTTVTQPPQTINNDVKILPTISGLAQMPTKHSSECGLTLNDAVEGGLNAMNRSDAGKDTSHLQSEVVDGHGIVIASNEHDVDNGVVGTTEIIVGDESRQEDTGGGDVECGAGAEETDGDQLVSDDILGGSTIYQTDDGYLLIQRPDGVTLQLQGEKNISLDTLQKLLTLDAPFT